MIAKRLFDLLASAVGLMVLAPLLLCIAVAIKIESPGPVFFRQERIGRGGQIFAIHKFRTMRVGAEHEGPLVTIGRDTRITKVGAVLRKYKLDELAQLIDVLCGNMSLVGPRPEVPRYVAQYPADIRVIVLSVRPGITDRASIEYKDENEILDLAEDPQYAYIHEVLPTKLRYYVDYVQTRSFWGDIMLIFATFRALLR